MDGWNGMEMNLNYTHDSLVGQFLIRLHRLWCFFGGGHRRIPDQQSRFGGCTVAIEM